MHSAHTYKLTHMQQTIIGFASTVALRALAALGLSPLTQLQIDVLRVLCEHESEMSGGSIVIAVNERRSALRLATVSVETACIDVEELVMRGLAQRRHGSKDACPPWTQPPRYQVSLAGRRAIARCVAPSRIKHL